MAYLCEGHMALRRLAYKSCSTSVFSSLSLKFTQQKFHGEISKTKIISRILMTSATSLETKLPGNTIDDLDFKALTNDEWKKRLTPEQFEVCRLSGTERPHSGEYYLHNKAGIYICVCCKLPLFSSENKYNCTCGWPTFTSAISDNVKTKPDQSHGMERTEVNCAKCNSHLGHLFDSGPPPTGKSYCINSVALYLVKNDPKKESS